MHVACGRGDRLRTCLSSVVRRRTDDIETPLQSGIGCEQP